MIRQLPLDYFPHCRISEFWDCSPKMRKIRESERTVDEPITEALRAGWTVPPNVSHNVA